ncbi:MAG: tRNA (adenosine(37)-N6)-threonylcarbamoyltransferase complex dimerization subunit type 1 TsaB [Lachnospiraceae bacterium]|nr:tRNA (adenosine(37)-N6)-threonylcarbamoyltransferase complex dimerization subunit type 1 TsaB [Lachnospiraceae bacterium]
MKILAIESSSLVASCALITDGSVAAEYTVCHKKTHSQTLMPMIAEIFKMTEYEPSDIDAVAVASGPGSFTGLRIGGATAKGFAEAIDKPVIPVPTVDAMAMNLFGCRDLIVPMMDARREETYSGIYTFEGDRLKILVPQNAGPVTKLMEKVNDLGQRVFFLGDGVPVFKEKLEDGIKCEHYYAPPGLNRQRAACVGALAQGFFEEGRYVSAGDFKPEYLRVSQAEREAANKANDSL